MPKQTQITTPVQPAPPQPPHRAIYLGRNRALTSLYTGHKIFVDTRDVGIAAHLLWEGRWEPWIDTHVLQAIEPGMIVCDIGANFGYYTLLMAEKVGPTGHVHAFEPNPRAVQLLQDSVDVNGFNGRVTVHSVALGNMNCRLPLRIQENQMGGAFIDERELDAGDNPFFVEVRRLDDVIPSDLGIGFLKIDVEGHEEAVLAGSDRVLRGENVSGILLEFRHGGKENKLSIELIDRVISGGGTVSALEPDGHHNISGEGDLLSFPKNHLTNLLMLKAGGQKSSTSSET